MPTKIAFVANAAAAPTVPAPTVKPTAEPTGHPDEGFPSEITVPQSKGNFPLGTLTVAFDKEFPPYSPVVMLYQEKLAEKRGLGVHFVPFDIEDKNRISEFRRAELLRSGGFDILLTTMNSYALWGGPEVGRVTAIIGESAGADKAVVQSSSIKTFNDFYGKAVAYSDSSVSEYLLYYMFCAGGVPAQAVIRLGHENLNQAMRRYNDQQSHAVVGWTSSDLDAALKRPGSKVLMNSDQFRVTTDVIVTGTKALQTKPTAVQAFHDAWFEANKMVFEHPDQAAASMTAWNASWTGVASRQDLDDALGEFAQATLADNRVMLTNENLPVMQARYKDAQSVWLCGGREVRQLVHDAELPTVFDPTFVRKSAQDVTLVSSRLCSSAVRPLISGLAVRWKVGFCGGLRTSARRPGLRDQVRYPGRAAGPGHQPAALPRMQRHYPGSARQPGRVQPDDSLMAVQLMTRDDSVGPRRISMTQFGGSFRFVQLPAVAQLLAELRSTGRLFVSHAEWTGEIVVREGQIVGARLGTEHGRAAFEAIAVALPDAEFSFTDEPVAVTSEPLVSATERTAYLDRLGAEHQRLVKLVPSLGLVPRLVSESDGNSADTQVTIGAAALQLIPSLVSGQSLGQIARQRGLVRTLRDVANLMEGGLVKLDPQPGAATRTPVRAPHVVDKPVRNEAVRERPGVVQHVIDKPMGDTPVGETAPVGKTGIDKPAAVLPFSARAFAARSSAAAAGGSVALATEESSQPTAVSRQMPPRLAVTRHSTPGAVSAQPPAVNPPGVAVVPPAPAVVPPGVAARLSAARNFAIEPPAPRSFVTPARVNLGGWRKAIVGFFLTDEPGA